jgi:hypothetical protein
MSLQGKPQITITANTPTAVSTSVFPVAFVQFVAPSSNVGTVFIGDANVSAAATVGFPLVPGAGQFYPVIRPWNGADYDLSKIYVDGNHSGDVLRYSPGLPNP